MDTDKKILCARSDITIQKVGDETMLYDRDGEKIHVLNHSAYSIWKLCDGHNTIEDICERMTVQYPDAGPSLIDDIQATIEQLESKMLLV